MNGSVMAYNITRWCGHSHGIQHYQMRKTPLAWKVVLAVLAEELNTFDMEYINITQSRCIWYGNSDTRNSGGHYTQYGWVHILSYRVHISYQQHSFSWHASVFAWMLINRLVFTCKNIVVNKAHMHTRVGSVSIDTFIYTPCPYAPRIRMYLHVSIYVSAWMRWPQVWLVWGGH